MTNVRGIDGVDLHAQWVCLIVEGVGDRAIVRFGTEEEAVHPAGLDVFELLDARRCEVFQLLWFGLLGVARVQRAERVSNQTLTLDRSPRRQLRAEASEELAELRAIGFSRIVVLQSLAAALEPAIDQVNVHPRAPVRAAFQQSNA